MRKSGIWYFRTVLRSALGVTVELKVEVGLHQESALSPFLIKILMNRLTEEVRLTSSWTI